MTLYNCTHFLVANTIVSIDSAASALNAVIHYDASMEYLWKPLKTGTQYFFSNGYAVFNRTVVGYRVDWLKVTGPTPGDHCGTNYQ